MIYYFIIPNSPHTHKTYSVQSSLFAEKRLCHNFDTPDHVQQSFEAKEDIEKNKTLKGAVTEYQSAFMNIQKLKE
jgi:hypothetical protein